MLGLVDLGEDLGSDLREVGTWRAVGRGGFTAVINAMWSLF